jgi:hypothetical protein
VHRIEVVAPTPIGHSAMLYSRECTTADRRHRSTSRSLFASQAPPLTATIILGRRPMTLDGSPILTLHHGGRVTTSLAAIRAIDLRTHAVIACEGPRSHRYVFV